MKKEKKPLSIGWIITITMVGCIAIWVLGALLTHCYANKYFAVPTGNSAPALFGDSFGAVNALISAFAFAGMIITIFLQRKEISLQSEELKEQRFENTFFHLLEVQQEIVENLSLYRSGTERYSEDSGTESGMRVEKERLREEITTGRKVFSDLYLSREVGYTTYVGLAESLRSEGLSKYDHSFGIGYFDHYFRHLYTIVKYVDRQPDDFLDDDKKYEYVSMIRATLSCYELVWLFYNGLSPQGNAKFKPLIEKYALLNNLRPELLVLNKDNLTHITSKGSEKLNLFLCSDQEGYSKKDFEFYISPDANVLDKYSCSAFKHDKEEIDLLAGRIKQWQETYL